MSIQTTTNRNNQDNSLNQKNFAGDNTINLGGSVGGQTTQTSNPTTSGSLSVTVPALVLMNLDASMGHPGMVQVQSGVNMPSNFHY